jgi:hypothetical protein
MSAGSTPSMSSQSWRYARSNQQPVKFLSWTAHHRSEQDAALDATAWQDGYMLDGREARCESQRHLATQHHVKHNEYVGTLLQVHMVAECRLDLGAVCARQRAAHVRW